MPGGIPGAVGIERVTPGQAGPQSGTAYANCFLLKAWPRRPRFGYIPEMIVKKLFPLMLMTLALAGLPSPAGADPGPPSDCDRAARRIEHTRDLLGRTAERVLACNSEKARALLKNATELNDAAGQQVLSGRCKAAVQLADRANERALELLALKCEGGGGGSGGGSDLGQLDPGFVQLQLDRTDEILSRVGPLVKERGDERAQRILDEANQMQQRARGLFNEAVRAGGNVERASMLLNKAYELTLGARDRVRRAEDFAGHRSGANPDRVAEELRQTDELIASGLEYAETSGSSEVLQRIGMARDLETQARRFYDQRDFSEALRLTLRARELVRAALGGVATVNSSEVDRAMALAEESLNQARAARLSQPGSRFLAQAELLYSRAQQQRQNGRPRLALLSAQGARSMAIRALESTAP